MSNSNELDVASEPSLVVPYGKHPVLFMLGGVAAAFPGLLVILFGCLPRLDFDFRVVILCTGILLVVPGLYVVTHGMQVLWAKPSITITPNAVAIPGRFRMGVQAVIPFASIKSLDVTGTDSKAQIVITHSDGQRAYISEWLLKDTTAFDEVWSMIDYLLECEETGHTPHSRRLFCSLCGESARLEDMFEGACPSCAALSTSDHRHHAWRMLALGTVTCVVCAGADVFALLLMQNGFIGLSIFILITFLIIGIVGFDLWIQALVALFKGEPTRYF